MTPYLRGRLFNQKRKRVNSEFNARSATKKRGGYWRREGGVKESTSGKNRRLRPSETKKNTSEGKNGRKWPQGSVL